MAELTLKRGWGMVFPGTNWKLAGDKQWRDHRLYIPSGREKLMGNRSINGAEYVVFQCLDDDFFAQPVATCEAPLPEDMTEVTSFPLGEPPLDKVE